MANIVVPKGPISYFDQNPKGPVNVLTREWVNFLTPLLFSSEPGQAVAVIPSSGDATVGVFQAKRIRTPQEGAALPPGSMPFVGWWQLARQQGYLVAIGTQGDLTASNIDGQGLFVLTSKDPYKMSAGNVALWPDEGGYTPVLAPPAPPVQPASVVPYVLGGVAVVGLVAYLAKKKPARAVPNRRRRVRWQASNMVGGGEPCVWTKHGWMNAEGLVYGHGPTPTTFGRHPKAVSPRVLARVRRELASH